MADFWDAVVEAFIEVDEGGPRFSCTIDNGYGKKIITIYLDENFSRKSTMRRFTEGLSSTTFHCYSQVIDRIIDDLFDRFGASGHLKWDPDQATKCNLDWAFRMLRRDLKRRGIPNTMTREQVECVLNELYIIEPVLNQ